MNQENLDQTKDTQKPDILKIIKSKIPPKVMALLTRFYAKKTIFWPVTISFGLIFLIIVLGLIFGNGRKSARPQPTTTPTPISGFEQREQESTLTKTEADLENLKSRINSLDVNQGKLKPPMLNFDVSF